MVLVQRVRELRHVVHLRVDRGLLFLVMTVVKRRKTVEGSSVLTLWGHAARAERVKMALDCVIV